MRAAYSSPSTPAATFFTACWLSPSRPCQVTRLVSHQLQILAERSAAEAQLEQATEEHECVSSRLASVLEALQVGGEPQPPAGCCCIAALLPLLPLHSSPYGTWNA